MSDKWQNLNKPISTKKLVRPNYKNYYILNIAVYFYQGRVKVPVVK